MVSIDGMSGGRRLCGAVRFYLFLAGVLVMFGAGAAELVEGARAPDFDLQDQYGKRHSLSDYRGNWVVLYFYPKDNTPGCTTEACAFRDDILQFRTMGVAVLGVSLDSVDSHKKFAEQHGLPFPLLADPGGKVAESYGVLWAFGPIRFARRRSFLIDPQGRVARAYRSVKPEGHSDQLIGDLKRLGAGGGRAPAQTGEADNDPG
jgi:peroxiredoxin Q/BCP